jgi:uncharacterized membrane protein YhhN
VFSSHSSNAFNWLSPFSRRILYLSIFLSLTFWICTAFPPFSGRFILKATSILALALIVWKHRQSKQLTLLFVALIFHSFGDGLLDIDRSGLFLPALATFLIGHIFYILTFKPDVSFSRTLSNAKKFWIAAIILFAAGLGTILFPKLENHLVIPVFIYMAAIVTMTICTVLANYRTAWISLGAMSYLLSDAMIAVNTFVQPFAASAFLIWPMYYLGQFLIVIGFLREKQLVDRSPL